MTNKIKFAFFGSSKFSVFCLEELKKLDHLPTVIVTTADKPQGRKMEIIKSEVKIWAENNQIEYLTTDQIENFDCELYLVASYGKIISKKVLDTPKFGVLNIHPSLLPKYRGSSPLQTQILNDEKKVGVTIMQIDEQIDHGPIVAQKELEIKDWPVKFEALEKITAEEGVKLFAQVLPDWIDGKIEPTTQNHSAATFTKKIEKSDGLIDIVNGNPYQNFLKIQAYSLWPQAYFFIGETRVIIKDAEFKDGVLNIKRVLPAGKKEMTYEDFQRGLK
ncbi:MAG: methionyl-tRNA formyltransferase [Candidatus Paceibacterota bacterium]